MFLVISILVLLGVVLCYLWIKLINLIFNPIIRWLDKKSGRVEETKNPYILKHLAKLEKEKKEQAKRNKLKQSKDYQEYMEWLKVNRKAPLDK